jgi:hypothetical protein
MAACYVGNTHCAAVCDCAPEFLGSDSCSLNTTELLVKRALRVQVIQSIQQLITMEDADQQSMEGWISSLVSVSQAPDELSSEGVSALLSSIGVVIDGAADSDVSVDTVATLLSSVDASLQANAQSSALRRRLAGNPGLAGTDDLRRLSQSNASTLDQAVSIVDKFRAFAMAAQLPGQDATEVTLPQFRILVQKLALSAGSQSSDSVLVSSPRTPLEVLNEQSVNSLSIPLNRFAESANSLDVAITSLRSGLFNTELALSGNKQIFSSALTVQLSGLPCSGDDCRVEIVLPTSAAMEVYASAQPVRQEFNTTCVVGDSSKHEYTCPDGTAQTVHCNGTSYLVTSRCPVTTYAPTCSALLGNAVSGAGCTVKARTAADITCSCPASALQSFRRLQANDDDTTTSSTTSVSYVAMLSEVKTNFEDTVISAQGLNAETLEKGWTAFVTIGCLAGAILFSLHWSHQADAEMDKKIKPDGKVALPAADPKIGVFASTMDRLRKMLGRPLSGGRSIWNARSSICISKDVLIAEQALPAILGSNTLTNRVKDELKHHHKWFGIVFFFSRAFPRVLRVMSLATNVIIMLFIQSITYALTNPDDGTCESMKTEGACLGPSSPYATGESKCQWMAGSSQCVLVQPDSNVKVILFVAIFSALVCTPLALLVDWLIMNVLSAPVRKDANARAVAPDVDMESATAVVPSDAAQASAATAEDRRRSSLSRSIFGSVFGSLFGSEVDGAGDRKSVSLLAQSDLRKLVADITTYRNALQEDQRTEFDGKSLPNISFPTIVGNSSFFLDLVRCVGPR